MASEGPRFDPLQTHHSSSLINRRCVKMCGSVAKWIMRPTSTLFFFCKTKNVRSFVFFLKTLVIILNKQRLLLLLLFLNLAREDDCDDEDAHHRCSG